MVNREPILGDMRVNVTDNLGKHEVYNGETWVITEYETIEKLRAQNSKLQKERDLLFTAHSYEMVRADELQIECDRLYRIIELNEKMADRVYDFDNPLLDVCKHGNDSACKECYLETVKK